MEGWLKNCIKGGGWWRVGGGLVLGGLQTLHLSFLPIFILYIIIIIIILIYNKIKGGGLDLKI